ncbi:aldose 1-epimerase family protein [Sphingomonas sp. BT-65]|uniref:aldose 1-epimerase family protein n=1 Tax=Sphingomonas sp. BT-65 TaxID=2989821 RepID=UPI002235EDDD|nr:aldose 1-epimerase family protein [Sphingomonas sp. BT-65]MCW4462534.1 aldose 1-epimerase family protein [Sphingomonas sp. BT-65]
MLEIANGILTARINPLGAELSSLTDADGRELMTDADPAYWTGRAPLLFPIVGALNGGVYRLDGREYALPQHGFARRSPFTLTDRAADRAVFRLEDDAETRRVYPFAFALDAAFTLDGATLTMEVTIANRDSRDMPASFGFHPAFAWPLPDGGAKEDHRIIFAQDEPASLNRIEGGLIGAANRDTPVEGDTLWLRDDLFGQDALVWQAPQSRALRYGGKTGPQLDIAFPEMPTLAIWTKPGARFVCVEPWQGHADPVGYASEIWDKPGMVRLRPGEHRSFAMTVTLA